MDQTFETGDATAPHVPRAQRLLALQHDALRLSQRISGHAHAEDTVQEAYLRAVRAGVPALDDDALRKWFLQVVANAARDMLRSDSRRRTREVRYMDTTPSNQSGSALSAERAAQLERAFAALEPRQREVLTLRYEMGLSFDEVAQVLDQPAASLRVVAQRAMQALREALGAQQPATDDTQLGAMLALLPILPLSKGCSDFIASIVSGTARELAATAAASAPAAAKTGLVVGAGNASGSAGVKLALVGAACCALVGLGAWMYARSALPIEVPSPAASVEPIAPKQPAAPPEVPPLSGTPNTGTFEATPRAVIPRIPLTDTGWKNALNLMKEARPEKDAVAGAWSGQNGTLRTAPAQYARIMLPLEFVVADYDLRIDFVRESGDTDVCILLPYRDRTIALKIGAFGNMRAFFDSGTQTHDLRVPGRPGIIQNGTPYSAVLKVRGDALRAELNGQLIAETKLGETPVGAEPGWRMPDPRRMGVGAWLSDVRFLRVAMRLPQNEAAAENAPEPEAPAAAALIRAVPDVDPEQLSGDWREAKKLIVEMPAELLDRSQGFVRVNDTLRAKAQAPAKINLGYRPPEEYDIRVRFKRTSGNKDVVLMLSQNGRAFCWKVGGWSNSIAGFDTIAGGVSAKSRAALMMQDIVTNGRSYTTVVQVRRDGLRAYLDGRLLMTWRGDYSAFAIENFWSTGDPNTLGVGSYDSAVDFESIEVRELSAPVPQNQPAVRPPKSADPF